MRVYKPHNICSIIIVLSITTGCLLSMVVAEQGNFSRKLCEDQSSCRDCIATAPRCTWCADNNYTSPRCNYEENHNEQGCIEIKNPLHDVNLIEDNPTSDGTDGVKPVIMKPQKIHLRLRAHETKEIEFQFYKTKDSAVDMFFLMDTSSTMKNYINQIGTVSLDLVTRISNLTGSLQFGIGSFIEKPLLPFITLSGTVDQHNEAKSVRPFKLVLEMTQNTTLFKSTFKKMHDSTMGNADTPEAGLEAMMQAIVCEDDIGWRNESRRIIIYCSDAPFHYAGDGKLAGVVVPNDGKCHMENGTYQYADEQDYPSVQHIAYELKKKQIITIFAVADNEQMDLYRMLASKMESGFVRELNQNTSSIADIVESSYKNILATIDMNVESNDLKVTIHTNCSGENWKSEKCNGTSLKQTVYFKAKITAGDCSNPGNKTIRITPKGEQATLEIQVELICDCNCTKVPASPDCNGQGTQQCGTCSCNSGFTGNKCECNKTETEKTEQCKMNNESEICSDRGTCVCGRCECKAKHSDKTKYYRGTYCECDDFSCPSFNRMLCGGISRGSCVCGKCNCTSDYEGDYCRCPRSTNACLAKSNKVCNGHGTCTCGECECHSGYRGTTCEAAPVCQNTCTIKKECIYCAASKDNKESCNGHCGDIPLIQDDSAFNEDINICEVDKGACILKYQCVIQNDTEHLKVDKKEVCTKSDALGMILGLGLGIPLGVLLLILLVTWRILLRLKSRQYDLDELRRDNRQNRHITTTSGISSNGRLNEREVSTHGQTKLASVPAGGAGAAVAATPVAAASAVAETKEEAVPDPQEMYNPSNDKQEKYNQTFEMSSCKKRF